MQMDKWQEIEIEVPLLANIALQEKQIHEIPSSIIKIN